MKPDEFLSEEFENVKRTLEETLRYDYGPDSTRLYFEECSNRLKEIQRQIVKTRPHEIWARLDELTSLAGWICLIERSRLGEFSWPFAELIRNIARPLLAETHLRGNKIEPIIHVVAEGEGYQIVYEQVPPPSSKFRFAIVAFPRPLKQHVLLHTIFGHELGHTAQDTNGAGDLISRTVRPLLVAMGHLRASNAMTTWLQAHDAPHEIKVELQIYRSDTGEDYVFPDEYLSKWVEELICDLFGLLLFGPGFVAAHKALLNPSHRTAYEFGLTDPTHPPYAVRHKMLVRALRLLNWDKPVTDTGSGRFYNAEKEALNYVLEDPYVSWASFFDDRQLETALQELRKVLSHYGSFGFEPPRSENLISMIDRLTKRLPPVGAEIDPTGKPRLTEISMAHALLAGWIYWLGKKHLVPPEEELSFFHINQLCDLALLQQGAITMVVEHDRSRPKPAH